MENKQPSVTSSDQERNYLIPGAIVLAGVVIAAAIVWSRSPAGPATVTGGMKEETPRAAAQELYDETDPVLGNPDAKVTMVEFGDFQCPFCGRFFQQAEGKLIEKYVKTGKMKFVYKDFAFLGPESNWAAEAAHCAGDQGKFWQYHDFLYKYLWDNYYAHGINGENVGAFSKGNLKKFASELGFDVEQFSQCLDSGKHVEKVKKSTNQGRLAGATGTPTNFINGRAVAGALPYEQFEALIEEELK